MAAPTIEIVSHLTTGVVFGLAAGISPGPLLTLVIAETIRHNKIEGIKVACAPLITDLPIVLVSLVILNTLSGFNILLGLLSWAGALFIIYLAWESITIKGIEVNDQQIKLQSLQKGIIANFLSPNPYLFWLTIGAPLVFKAWQVNAAAAILYIAGFYVMLVGSKIVIAIVVDTSKTFLKSNAYLYIIRALGFVLLLFAIGFIQNALQYLNIIPK
ncbi:MAG: LysE family transporter [Sedimentisphaerales bacterium]|nr:LysE family transporter [Sedimentisphaerales bacterium]